MSIESLDREIAQARAEFTRLNAGRWRQVFKVMPGTINPKVSPSLRYCQFDHETEACLVELCDRIARLLRFRSELFARNYALDGTRGIEFS